jgi:NAD(P)-dependent dehydrogenase (short-subunit alcohol dehydrogenase family)
MVVPSHSNKEYKMTTKGTALVTGATSGLGFEAAAQLAEEGWNRVIVTGRSKDKAEKAVQALVERTGKNVFSSVAVDLGRSADVKAAVATLAKDEPKIDFLLLNAGSVQGSQMLKTEANIEVTFASSLVGHHQLALQLLSEQLLAPNASIIIAGSEAARGDVPTFNPTDIRRVASDSFDGDLVAAAEGLFRGTSVKYKPAVAYADAKLFVAYWAAQLAAKLPDGMSVNAVSPGSAPDTQAARNANFFMKRFMMPVFNHAPARFGLSSSVSDAAHRYLEVESYEGVTGEFFASAPKKMTGPIEAMKMPHLHDETIQEAAWSALVAVSGGVDFPVNA